MPVPCILTDVDMYRLYPILLCILSLPKWNIPMSDDQYSFSQFAFSRNFSFKIFFLETGYTKRYWKLKEEALDRTLWRTRFGRGYGPVVRQTTE
jgi:hypothetical protein